MHYDPIKKYLNKFFNLSPTLRILFYKLLDILLLRTWYIKREIKKWDKDVKNQKSKVKSDLKILDAGSGFGQYSYYLSILNRGWKILGVDIWEEHIHDCNNFFVKLKKDNISFRIADLTKFIKRD